MDNSIFEKRNKKKILQMKEDTSLDALSKKWISDSYQYEYSYHFKWLGLPIIQYPQDIIALQEIIWKLKPDLIIETGVARGGSVTFLASMLEIIGKGEIIGIDIKIHQQNKKAIEKHPMFKRITLIEGSSINKKTINKINQLSKNKKCIMVILDSNHTHKHVLSELKAYSQLITKGSYLIVFDTLIEFLPNNFFKNRPWTKTKNPKSAIREFLKTTNRFKIDKNITNKLLITAAPDGYLKCVKK
ncbi:cephalosporin hydroxylase [Candidatus Nitrosopumilus sp. SW]|uniref:cephalosporin hydroxylase family protein n=1 Tax=Candidatus Nitrosopumilus sp. SW TaxID=2508726 RepID=UPI00114F6A31|nr:CmcI family methyltransferase [Candidatus Nitrosopumilus sp. SW]QDI88773.1 cephalosporin hydroxylase [Candidatus Nitrosopumilus sp. SW]